MTRTSSIAAVLGILVLAAQLSGAQGKRASSRGEERIAREVRHELVMLPYYSVFDNLAYRVQGYTVTLMGQVTRPTLKSDAEKAVKQVEGVENVINNIEVLPLSPSDDRIRRAVYYRLFSENSPLLRYGIGSVPPIHIIVKNGNITLVGVVDSVSDKNLAGMLAKQVPGTFSVTNDLVVEKS